MIGQDAVRKILQDTAFTDFRNINVLPLIYQEKTQRCNIMVFDSERAMTETVWIIKEQSGREDVTLSTAFMMRIEAMCVKYATEELRPMRYSVVCGRIRGTG